MTNKVLAVVLLLLAIGGVVVRKTYYSLPVRELKRRAARGDPIARQLYRAVAYGSSLRSLLWLYIGLTSAGAMILLARWLPVWASLLIVAPLLWAAFSWLPASRVSKPAARLTGLITPAIAWLLNYLHPPLSRSAEALTNRSTAKAHTGIYERSDLLALIKQQRNQADNRLSDEELEIVWRALSFNEHYVADVLSSRKDIKTILADDTVGPILIDELHKSGQDYALVLEKPKGEIVGTLRFNQLNLQASGKVRNIMNQAVYYVHESDNLSEVLHAFFVTNEPLFIAVSSAAEYVGIVTIENILRQLLGHLPGENFDQYADRAAVASRHQKSTKAEKSDDTPVKTDDEVV